MEINFDKLKKLNIRISSYDFKYTRLLDYNPLRYEEFLEESEYANLVFNDTKELDELIYTLCDLRKRLEVEKGRFVNYDFLNESLYNKLSNNIIKNSDI